MVRKTNNLMNSAATENFTKNNLNKNSSNFPPHPSPPWQHAQLSHFQASEQQPFHHVKNHNPQPNPVNSWFELHFQKISNFVLVKLDFSNFLVQKYQPSSILISTNIVVYVDWLIDPQPRFLNLNNFPLLNLLFLEWRDMDHFVQSCIYAVVVPSLVTNLLGKYTSHDKWNHFTQQFFAHKYQLRGQLDTIRRCKFFDPSFYSAD